MREMADTHTDEVMEWEQTIELIHGSKHFWKCCLKGFLKVMESLNSKRYKVFIYIIEHIKPSDNNFIGTYSKIEDDTECCGYCRECYMEQELKLMQ